MIKMLLTRKNPASIFVTVGKTNDGPRKDKLEHPTIHRGGS